MKTLIVNIVGPDGAGKSTLASELSRILLNEGNHVIHKHFDLRSHVQSNKSIKPSEQLVRNPILSILSILIRFFRFRLYFLKILFSGKKPQILIQERGWFDQSADPQRYRISTTFMIRVLGRLLPKVDLFLLPSAPAEIIAHRKNEKNVKETQDQLTYWNREFTVTILLGTPEQMLLQARRSISEKQFDSFVKSLKLIFPTPRRFCASISGASASSLDSIYLPMKITSRMLSKVRFVIPARRDDSLAIPLGLIKKCFVDSLSTASGVLMSHNKDGKKVLFCVLDSNGSMKDVYKLSGNLAASEREKTNLVSLSSLDKTFSVPILKGYEKDNEGLWSCLHMSAVPHVNRSPLSKAENEGLLIELKELGITHGDLHPWNAYKSGNVVCVVDWEFAEIRL